MGILKVDLAEFKQNHRKYCHAARANGDILELEYPGGELGMYVVTTHRGVNEVLKNDCGHFVHFADYFAALENKSEVDQQIGEIFARNLGNNDPIHLELRKDIRTHFNGAGLDQHITFMQDCISELIEHLRKTASANNGVIDLVADFCEPLAFLVTSHIIGLDFATEEDKVERAKQAGEAIKLINLLASDEDKRAALSQQQALCEFILPQLQAHAEDKNNQLRADCLLHDFGEKLRTGDAEKLQNYVEMVNGLFQAGLGAVGSFLALCMHLILVGDENNTPQALQQYYFDPARSDEEKREAIAEFIRLEQGKLSGLIPRYVTDDSTLMGAPMRRNSLIYMNFAAANYDEAAFETPLKFKAGRAILPKGLSKEQIAERRQKRLEKNVSFSYGEHMCPGRRISLTMIRYALDGLFEAFPNIESKELNAFSEVMGKPATVISYDIDLNI
ncbi:MAG: cytochrome P450 [Halieaceae bacterium]|jgi:cytochrome P450|nr:cytochrome P450 [Halieaceae bacterium]